MADYDVAVIGAGYGGASVAALLSLAGLRVLLLEKNRFAGGKAVTLGRGPNYELWPIVGAPARGSRIDELLRLLGEEDAAAPILPARVCEFMYQPSAGPRRSFYAPAGPVWNPIQNIENLARLGIPPRALGGAFATSVLTTILPEWGRARLDQISIYDLLRRFRLPAPAMSWLCALFNVLFVVPVDRLPASEALGVLRDIQFGGAGRYHTGGLGRVAEAGCRQVAARGGKVVLGAYVEKIRVGPRGVEGIVTSAGEYRVSTIVSSAGIQPTVLKLVGVEHFPANYVQHIRRLEPSWAMVGVRYHLRKPVFQVPMTLAFSDESWWNVERFQRAQQGQWPDAPLVYAVVPSMFDPRMGGPHHTQVALLGTLGSPDVDSPMNDRAIALLERHAQRLWPELRDAIVRRGVYSARHVSRLSRDAVLPGQGGECIGIGQLIGQCGRSKPDPRSPLRGLYFVGTDAGGHGCGTHQAVESAFAVAPLVLRDRASARRQ